MAAILDLHPELHKCPIEDCPHGDWPGAIEAQVTVDLAALGDLAGVGKSLAEAAKALARALDVGAGLSTAAVARELRATLGAIAELAGPQSETDEDGDLGKPI